MLRQFCLFSLFIFKCYAIWQPPVTLVFPESIPASLLTGDIDLSGNTVVAWQDPVSSHWLSSIYLANSPSWDLVQTVTTDNVLPSLATSINSSGQAIAVWVDQTSGNLYFAINNDSGWSNKKLIYSPTSGVSLFDPQVAIDEEGNALLIFSDFDGTTTTVYASYYTSGVWMPPTPLNSATGLVSAPISIALLDKSGNGLLVWGFFNGTTASTYAATFDKNSEQYTVQPVLGLNQSADPTFIGFNPNYIQAAISASGQAIVAWTLGSGGIWSSLYLNGSFLPTIEVVANPNE